MAECNTETLLDSGRCFSCLTRKQADLVEVALYKEWLLSVDAEADVTPAGIMDRGKCFDCLTTKQLEITELQLLCEALG